MRLINALRTGEFTQDFVLDEMNHLKQECEDGSKRLEELQQLKDQLSKLENP